MLRHVQQGVAEAQIRGVFSTLRLCRSRHSIYSLHVSTGLRQLDDMESRGAKEEDILHKVASDNSSSRSSRSQSILLSKICSPHRARPCS